MQIQFSTKKTAIALALLASLTCGRVMANSFDFSGASIVSNGTGLLTLAAQPGGNLTIDDGSATGLTGDITGIFQIGTVPPGAEYASLTGPGSLVINDGVATLTASFQWIDIAQSGTSTYLNVNGVLNLGTVAYNGVNPDLLALKLAGSGYITLSANIFDNTADQNPIYDLTQLAHTPGTGSFDGQLTSNTVPDGGTTALLIVLGLAGVALGAIAQNRRLVRA